MIEGVKIKELKMICDNRGFLMEILRGTDKEKADGNNFGQVYLSTAYPAVIKGKHMHKLQTDHMTVIKGRAVLHLEDGRENSPTFGKKWKIEMGEDNWKMVVIPPQVWHSFENVGTDVCYFINYVTKEYDPKEPDEYRGVFNIKDKQMKTNVSQVG